jgi:HIV Tat-specific factor 1
LLDADGKPKVKLYNNHATGEPNGEGLVVYYKEESVRLAINLLDDTPLRLGGNENIKVAEANWSHKENDGNTSDKDEEKAAAKKKRGKSDAEKQKMQRRAEKLLRDAADYDPSYDEKDNAVVDATAAAAGSTSAVAAPTAKNAGGRVVVLQYVFTLEELAEDASLLLDLKEDVRDECESLGKVTNVVLYDVSYQCLF